MPTIPAGSAPQLPQPAPPTRQELQNKAQDLGIVEAGGSGVVDGSAPGVANTVKLAPALSATGGQDSQDNASLVINGSTPLFNDGKTALSGRIGVSGGELQGVDATLHHILNKPDKNGEFDAYKEDLASVFIHGSFNPNGATITKTTTDGVTTTTYGQTTTQKIDSDGNILSTTTGDRFMVGDPATSLSTSTDRDTSPTVAVGVGARLKSATEGLSLGDPAREKLTGNVAAGAQIVIPLADPSAAKAGVFAEGKVDYRVADNVHLQAKGYASYTPGNEGNDLYLEGKMGAAYTISPNTDIGLEGIVTNQSEAKAQVNFTHRF